MHLRKIYNNRAVSPVISTILVIGIVTGTIAGILVWGMPFIDSSKHEAQFQNSKNDLLVLEESINQLVQTGTGSKKIAYITNFDDDSSVYVKNDGTRMVLWYSYNESLMNFSVVGLEDGDNTFKVHKKSGTGDITNVSVWWLNDTCFLAGTKVLMADGSVKNIENIRPGDNVKCYDFKVGKVVNSEVSYQYEHSPDEMGKYYLVINDDLCVTPNHRFYTQKGWIEAGNLDIDDKLFCFGNQKYLKINSIEKVFSKEFTYDLTVKNTRNFYVKNNDEFVLVHNVDPPDNLRISADKYIYTGFPYNFSVNYEGGPPSDNLEYNFSVNNQPVDGWQSENWTYYMFTSSLEDVEIGCRVRDNNEVGGVPASRSFPIGNVSYGEDYPYDYTNFNSTIIKSHNEITLSEIDTDNNYEIETEKNIKGTVRIDLYSDDSYLDKALPIGKIWVFDLGSITHEMQYSSKSYSNVYENGAVYYYSDDVNNPILTDDPNFYVNEDKDVIGLRVVQIRTDSGNYVSGSGEGIIKLNFETKNNYIRDMVPNSVSSNRTNITNFYIDFYGENSYYWQDFLSNYFNFKLVDSDTFRYRTRDVELILSSVIMKTNLVIK